jgi:hypothetical protein
MTRQQVEALLRAETRGPAHGSISALTPKRALSSPMAGGTTGRAAVEGSPRLICRVSGRDFTREALVIDGDRAV